MSDDASGNLRSMVAEEVRVAMARRRMRGVELAQAIHRSQAYVSRRLTGETAFDLDDLELIADALKVEVGDLLPIPKSGTGSVTRQIRSTGPRPRTVAVAGQDRPIRSIVRTTRHAKRPHRPGRAVSRTRPLVPDSRPLACLTAL